jgi:hypothetical protein
LLEEISSSSYLPESPTELRLLELDPQRVHVYWHIDPECESPDRRQILRVYDITATGDISRPEQTYDIPIKGREGRWYLDFWRGERVFVAELGYLDEHGSLERLALSNEVHTPPAGQLSGSEVVEINLDPNGKPVQTVQPALTKPKEAKAAPTTEEEAPLEEQAFPLLMQESVMLEEVLAEGLESEEDGSGSIRTLATPSLAGEAMVAFTEDDEIENTAGSGETAFPAADILEACAPENAIALEAFYRELERHAPAHPARTSEKNQMAQPAIEVRASESSPSHAPAQPVLSAPTPLESMVGWSSLMPAGGQNELLEIHAELRIYGRAKPGSRFTLHGQEIQLHADGTFSIVRKLPSGSVVFPLIAKSTP